MGGQAYFKCAYDCFDRRRTLEGINNCVENCSVPVLTASNVVETKMAKFQERLNRSLMVCQDKFEAAKLQKMKTDAAQELESCVNRSIDDSMRGGSDQVLPLHEFRGMVSFLIRTPDCRISSKFSWMD
ncbi:hypothetical protein ACP4OV_010407 [Aristida adscensionis]